MPAESSTKDASQALKNYSDPLSLKKKHKLKSFFKLLFAFPLLGSLDNCESITYCFQQFYKQLKILFPSGQGDGASALKVCFR